MAVIIGLGQGSSLQWIDKVPLGANRRLEVRSPTCAEVFELITPAGRHSVPHSLESGVTGTLHLVGQGLDGVLVSHLSSFCEYVSTLNK